MMSAFTALFALTAETIAGLSIGGGVAAALPFVTRARRARKAVGMARFFAGRFHNRKLTQQELAEIERNTQVQY